MQKIATGGARFRPDEENIYFIASSPHILDPASEFHEYLLVAVNEINDSNIETLAAWLDQGKCVLIDSGIFNLVMKHARKHSVSMEAALSLAPDEIDGFDQLFKRYVEIVKRYGERSWGYIELDQGGRVNKTIIRTRLEDMGLNPIPVYHPLVDGPEYFDELAAKYDRICFGNLVQAETVARRAMLARLWEQLCKRPDVWVHLLGVTPNELTNAYPVGSCDSSSWLGAARWGQPPLARACQRTVGNLSKKFCYAKATDQYRESYKFAGYQAAIDLLNWRQHVNDLQASGVVRHPQLPSQEKRK